LVAVTMYMMSWRGVRDEAIPSRLLLPVRVRTQTGRKASQ
jgi:hypothetical protein